MLNMSTHCVNNYNLLFFFKHLCLGCLANFLQVPEKPWGPLWIFLPKYERRSDKIPDSVNEEFRVTAEIK